MGYFLRVMCVLFVFACLSSADELQDSDFADKLQNFVCEIETLKSKTYSNSADKLQDFACKVAFWESEVSDDELLIKIIKDLGNVIFTEDERQAICDMELPSMKDCHEISGEDWLIYGEIIFVKILLLALQGEMVDAETLRIQFDTRSLLIRTSIDFPFKWFVLLRCVKVSEAERLSIQEKEEDLYIEELQRLQREHLEKHTMPLQSS